MIKSLIYSLVIALNVNVCIAQITTSGDSTDQKSEFLLGKISRSSLYHGDFRNYFMNEYAAYQPDSDLLKKLENVIYDAHISLIMATWCSDSQIQVPRFFKMLDLLDYNTNQVDLICVDHNKLAGNLDISLFSIEYVPTFIFFRNGNEVGRIIESPEISLEKDTYRILSD